MPARAVRRGRGVTRYPSRSSVHNITKLSQWTRLHKRGKNQLVFVMFTLEFVRNSHRLKTTLVELATHGDFKDVIFAVVDIDKAKEVADQEGVTDAPTFICYQANAVVDRIEHVSGDAAPSTLWQMLHRNAVRVRAEMARNYPQQGQSLHWKAVGKIIGFFAISIGAVLAVIFMSPDAKVEVRGSRRSRRRHSRKRSYAPSSDDE